MDEIVDEVDAFWQQQQKIALKYYQLILGDIDDTFSTKGNFLLKKIAQQINAIKQSSINNEEQKNLLTSYQQLSKEIKRQIYFSPTKTSALPDCFYFTMIIIGLVTIIYLLYYNADIYQLKTKINDRYYHHDVAEFNSCQAMALNWQMNKQKHFFNENKKQIKRLFFFNKQGEVKEEQEEDKKDYFKIDFDDYQSQINAFYNDKDFGIRMIYAENYYFLSTLINRFLFKYKKELANIIMPMPFSYQDFYCLFLQLNIEDKDFKFVQDDNRFIALLIAKMIANNYKNKQEEINDEEIGKINDNENSNSEKIFTFINDDQSQHPNCHFALQIKQKIVVPKKFRQKKINLALLYQTYFLLLKIQAFNNKLYAQTLNDFDDMTFFKSCLKFEDKFKTLLSNTLIQQFVCHHSSDSANDSLLHFLMSAAINWVDEFVNDNESKIKCHFNINDDANVIADNANADGNGNNVNADNIINTNGNVDGNGNAANADNIINTNANAAGNNGNADGNNVNNVAKEKIYKKRIDDAKISLMNFLFDDSGFLLTCIDSLKRIENYHIINQQNIDGWIITSNNENAKYTEFGIACTQLFKCKKEFVESLSRVMVNKNGNLIFPSNSNALTAGFDKLTAMMFNAMQAFFVNKNSKTIFINNANEKSLLFADLLYRQDKALDEILTFHYPFKINLFFALVVIFTYSIYYLFSFHGYDCFANHFKCLYHQLALFDIGNSTFVNAVNDQKNCYYCYYISGNKTANIYLHLKPTIILHDEQKIYYGLNILDQWENILSTLITFLFDGSFIFLLYRYSNQLIFSQCLIIYFCLTKFYQLFCAFCPLKIGYWFHYFHCFIYQKIWSFWTQEKIFMAHDFDLFQWPLIVFVLFWLGSLTSLAIVGYYYPITYPVTNNFALIGLPV